MFFLCVLHAAGAALMCMGYLLTDLRIGLHDADSGIGHTKWRAQMRVLAGFWLVATATLVGLALVQALADEAPITQAAYSEILFAARVAFGISACVGLYNLVKASKL